MAGEGVGMGVSPQDGVVTFQRRPYLPLPFVSKRAKVESYMQASSVTAHGHT